MKWDENLEMCVFAGLFPSQLGLILRNPYPHDVHVMLIHTLKKGIKTHTEHISLPIVLHLYVFGRYTEPTV